MTLAAVNPWTKVVIAALFQTVLSTGGELLCVL